MKKLYCFVVIFCGQAIALNCLAEFFNNRQIATQEEISTTGHWGKSGQIANASAAEVRLIFACRFTSEILSVTDVPSYSQIAIDCWGCDSGGKLRSQSEAYYYCLDLLGPVKVLQILNAPPPPLRNTCQNPDWPLSEKIKPIGYCEENGMINNLSQEKVLLKIIGRGQEIELVDVPPNTSIPIFWGPSTCYYQIWVNETQLAEFQMPIRPTKPAVKAEKVPTR